MVELSHCGKMVYTHDRDRFLLSLVVPENAHEALLAVYALNVELAQIQGKISEELIGQMRYAWWQERIEDLYAGKPTPGHPVLEALQSVTPYVPKELLMKLVEEYRESFFSPHLRGEGILDEISLHLLRSLCPDAESQWLKAQGIIAKHRKRYGGRMNAWLSFSLLIGL